VSALPLAASAIAGGLIVYIYFAARPTAYDEPVDIFAGGRFHIQQVAGLGGARIRILVALGALLACLVFLVGYLRG